MLNPEIKTLPIAVRVFPAPAAGDDHRSAKFWQQPEGMFIIHTEARDGTSKRGFIGSYQLIAGGESIEEGLFYGHLSKVDTRALRKLVASQGQRFNCFRLLTKREFLKLFYDLAYKARCLIVGFGLPMHLARIAFDCAPARGFFAGGFSLGLWSYIDEKGRERPNGFRPRVCVKYVDRKRSLISFTARNSPDQEDLIPEGSSSGEPKPGYRFPGHFLDLRTLAFALADEVYSLEAACESFGVKLGKSAS